MTGSPRRILIVDDNRDTADMLNELLSDSGHETRVAYDGAETLRVAEAFRPDVVLFDLGLPGLHGHEVARRLRQAPWGRELLLIAITGWGHEADRRESAAAGIDHHLVKPVDPAVLEELVGGT